MYTKTFVALVILVTVGATACRANNNGADSGCSANNYNEWQLSRCANLDAHYNDQFLRLDARYGAWPQDKFCQAIKTDLIKHGDYTMSVEMWNEQSIGGQNYGHMGLMFNVWDFYNYDFVYVLFHTIDSRIQTGNVTNGAISLKTSIRDASQITGPAWNTLKVVVTQTTKSAAVYLNAKKLGDFTFSSTARGHGGVIIANGYENIGKFRSFAIL